VAEKRRSDPHDRDVTEFLRTENGGVMAKLKRKEGKLTAADLASYGILPRQPDESKPVKSQELETLDGAAVSDERNRDLSPAIGQIIASPWVCAGSVTVGS
jgi:hypothetical protein